MLFLIQIIVGEQLILLVGLELYVPHESLGHQRNRLHILPDDKPNGKLLLRAWRKFVDVERSRILSMLH